MTDRNGGGCAAIAVRTAKRLAPKNSPASIERDPCLVAFLNADGPNSTNTDSAAASGTQLDPPGLHRRDLTTNPAIAWTRALWRTSRLIRVVRRTCRTADPGFAQQSIVRDPTRAAAVRLEQRLRSASRTNRVADRRCPRLLDRVSGERIVIALTLFNETKRSCAGAATTGGPGILTQIHPA